MISVCLTSTFWFNFAVKLTLFFGIVHVVVNTDLKLSVHIYLGDFRQYTYIGSCPFKVIQYLSLKFAFKFVPDGSSQIMLPLCNPAKLSHS